MGWDYFEIGKDLVGEPVKSGEGFYAHERQFITLPANEAYVAGYGFYISSRLAGDDYIRLPDDYNVVLQMSPGAREPGKRYKRYKLTGREIKDSVFLPYRLKRDEEEMAKEIARNKRNEKVMGKIVYGQYEGNQYGDYGDLFKAYFFCNGKRYYNYMHEKVANVRVDFVVIEDVSKRLFDEMVEEIKTRLRSYVCIRDCIEGLRAIQEPDERTVNMISLLRRENEQTLGELRDFLKKKSAEGIYMLNEEASCNPTVSEEKKADALIEELGLCARIYNSLHRSGVATIEQLAQCTEQELLGMRNMGAKSLREIKSCLAKRGFSLRAEKTNEII